MFLNCKWLLKNPWNNDFLRIYSWNVLEFYFSSFIKNSTHLFHDSSFWNWCLFIGSSYYFMMLRLVNLFLLIFVYVFDYYEIKLFKKTFKSIVIIFSTSLVFLKSIDMFLKCSWIVLEFSFQKLLATLRLFFGKMTWFKPLLKSKRFFRERSSCIT